MLFLWVEFMATLLLVVTNAGSSSGPGNCNLFLAPRFGPLLRFFLLRSVAQGSLLPRYQMRLLFIMVAAAH
jgi:hypothetical protein